MTLPECASLHRKETCKGYQELQAEIGRLRAEKEELNRRISNAAARCSDEATTLTLRAILAKTAKEVE